MTLTVKVLHEGLLECHAALQPLAKKLGITEHKLHQFLQTVLGLEATTPPQAPSIFKMNEDVVIHALGYLVIRDISRLDVAVSPAAGRSIFLSLIGSNKLSYTCPPFYSDTWRVKCIKFVAARRIRIRKLDAGFRLPLEIREALANCQFDRLVTISAFGASSEELSFLKAIADANSRIEELEIDAGDFALQLLPSVGPSIRRLKVCSYDLNPVLTLYNVLHHCIKLQKLDLRSWALPHGIHALPPIPSLTEVNIDHEIVEEDLEVDGPLLNDRHLREVADAAPNLEVIALNNMALTNAGYAYLAMKCPKIRSLTIGRSVSDWEVPPMDTSTAAALWPFLHERLTTLSVNLSKYAREERVALGQVLQSRGQWLQEVTLGQFSKCDPLLSGLLKGCSSLRKLNLWWVLYDTYCECLHSNFALEGKESDVWSPVQELECNFPCTMAAINDLARYMPKLVRLRSNCNHAVTGADLIALLSSCPDLTHITIHGKTPFGQKSIVHEESSLRSKMLELTIFGYLFPQLLLAARCMPKLLLLDMKGCSDSFNTLQIMTLLSYCPELKELSVSCYERPPASSAVVQDTHMEDIDSALQRLELLYSRVHHIDIIPIIRRCPQLTSITFTSNLTRGILDDAVAHAFSVYCPLLRRVNIRVEGVFNEADVEQMLLLLPNVLFYTITFLNIAKAPKTIEDCPSVLVPRGKSLLYDIRSFGSC